MLKIDHNGNRLPDGSRDKPKKLEDFEDKHGPIRDFFKDDRILDHLLADFEAVVLSPGGIDLDTLDFNFALVANRASVVCQALVAAVVQEIPTTAPNSVELVEGLVGTTNHIEVLSLLVSSSESPHVSSDEARLLAVLGQATIHSLVAGLLALSVLDTDYRFEINTLLDSVTLVIDRVDQMRSSCAKDEEVLLS
jgi:hypothetical protein